MPACELSSLWPDDLYLVCGSGQLIEPDAASSVFPTMIGWKVRIIRAGSELWLGSDQDPYFDYTSLTGEATWSTPPVDGEPFIIQAYKPA